VRAAELQILVAYNVWANRQVLAPVDRVPADRLSATAAVSHGGLLETLVHMGSGAGRRR
jgi:uncharacterized damage-inducible protein DinB